MRFHNIMTILIIFLFLFGCTTMKFNADQSESQSLEMSNVIGTTGQYHVNNEFETRAFFMLNGILPIQQKALDEAIGPCDSAHNIKIKSESGYADIGIAFLMGFLDFPLDLLAVQSRGYEVECEKE